MCVWGGAHSGAVIPVTIYLSPPQIFWVGGQGDADLHRGPSSWGCFKIVYDFRSGLSFYALKMLRFVENMLKASYIHGPVCMRPRLPGKSCL